jgi:hypothetical protein
MEKIMSTFKPTYLYIKTHNKTGLKYFGKTTQDPFAYKGSGKYWIRHLKVHGNDVSTEVYGVYTNNDECLTAARCFSEENDIVQSADWANLVIESLDGGDTSKTERYIKSLPKMIEKKKRFRWWNNGVHQYFCEDCPGLDYVRGRLPFNNVGSKIGSEIQKNQKWINNGLQEMMFPKNEQLPQGYSYGRLPSKKKNISNQTALGTFWWNDGKINKMSKTQPGPNFVLGRLINNK